MFKKKEHPPSWSNANPMELSQLTELAEKLLNLDKQAESDLSGQNTSRVLFAGLINIANRLDRIEKRLDSLGRSP